MNPFESESDPICMIPHSVNYLGNCWWVIYLLRNNIVQMKLWSFVKSKVIHSFLNKWFLFKKFALWVILIVPINPIIKQVAINWSLATSRVIQDESECCVQDKYWGLRPWIVRDQELVLAAIILETTTSKPQETWIYVI